MRIAIFSDTYPPDINGVATSSRNLFRTLNHHDEQAIAVVSNPFDKEFSFEDNVMRMSGIELKHLYGYVIGQFYNRQAMRLLREFDPDVIHIQTDGPIGQFGFLAASRLRCATVYTFHTMLEDYTYYVTRGHLDRAARGIVRSYVRYKSHSADEFITPSEKIREYMRSIGVDAYINIIPTGIDFGAFKRENVDKEAAEAIRRKLGLTPDTYVILSLGRVAKEKSIDVCLRGYALYLKKGLKQKTRMLVVGGGPAIPELEKLSEKLGISDHVTFVGRVNPDDTPLYYSLGDCFVSASTTETQGLTFMEAMASSNILFARYDDTLVGTIKDGENGFFFFDEPDFAEKLPKVIGLNALQRKMIRSAALKSIDRYSLDRFYESVMEVYRRAIRKNY
jgi:1,2-diacylglycerol 3-alpha-glucosyltransferase